MDGLPLKEASLRQLNKRTEIQEENMSAVGVSQLELWAAELQGACLLLQPVHDSFPRSRKYDIDKRIDF